MDSDNTVRPDLSRLSEKELAEYLRSGLREPTRDYDSGGRLGNELDRNSLLYEELMELGKFD